MTQRSNKRNFGLIAAISAAVVTVGGVGAYLATNHNSNVPVSPSTSQGNVQPQPRPDNPAPTEQTAQIYLLKDNGTNFELVSQPVEVKADASNPNEFLSATFQQLMNGPTEGTEASAIPKGTKLLGIKAQGDEVDVDLSEEFTAGGGSASMSGRLGQVIYTATTLNPNAKVFIKVNGKPLELLGGEGLEVQQPMTREIFDQDFPL